MPKASTPWPMPKAAIPRAVLEQIAMRLREEAETKIDPKVLRHEVHVLQERLIQMPTGSGKSFLLVKLLIDELKGVQSRQQPSDAASYLLALFLSKADRQAIPGDLEEEYWTDILPKYGERRARLWFWTQALQAIATRNPICKWLLAGTIFRVATEWFWRKIGG
jgi:hypothetical protein